MYGYLHRPKLCIHTVYKKWDEEKTFKNLLKFLQAAINFREFVLEKNEVLDTLRDRETKALTVSSLKYFLTEEVHIANYNQSRIFKALFEIPLNPEYRHYPKDVLWNMKKIYPVVPYSFHLIDDDDAFNLQHPRFFWKLDSYISEDGTEHIVNFYDQTYELDLVNPFELTTKELLKAFSQAKKNRRIPLSYKQPELVEKYLVHKMIKGE